MKDPRRHLVLAYATIIIIFVANSCFHQTQVDGSIAVDGSFYGNNELEQTIIYRALPKKEKREMQQEILTLLGLHHRPKPSTHKTDTSAPKYMLDLYKSFVDDGDDGGDGQHHHQQYLRHHYDVLTSSQQEQSQGNTPAAEELYNNVKDADVIMSFVNHADKDSGRVRHDRDRRLWFDVSEVSPGQDIMAAHLRLYRQSRRDRIDSDQNYTVNVYEIVEGSFKHRDRKLKMLDSISVHPAQEGWLILNVTAAMFNWVIYPHNNFGLFVRVHVAGKDRDVSPLKIGVVGHKGPQDHQPFMTGFFKTPTELHIRRTRAARRRQKKQSASYSDDFGWNPYNNFHDRHSKRSCQKRTLYVSFRDLGWQDWIIAPDGYAAFYCHGECSFPLNAHMNATNHAIVQTLVHLMNPYTVPKPCCAPTKLSAISVLYFDDNSNVILKKYKNMVVKSCGCH